ncbi:DUF2635 domain-containing protein [Sediminicurvatus halobius]|uniref:DUF2635 domain-containing protein n=1 Tax=Sediminicurvatus halobius TaxID=2182432 RepID=UPI0018EE5E95|nr:DUF2635 domain-containing protein [Spiribacter halobius]UEX76990.1 DUF2635 domain-containing protein [Spiribacter halobius]
MQESYLKPRDGLQVRKPDGRVLAAEGERVALTSYWRRRLRDGDVVEARPPRKPSKAESKE